MAVSTFAIISTSDPSTLTFQSSFLLNPSALPIFTPGIYFKVKLNLNK